MIYESISLSTSNPSWFIVEESPYHFIRSLIPDLPDEPGPHVLRSELPGQGLRVIRELHGRHGQPLVRPARLTGARSPVVASIRVWPHRWLRLPRPGLQSSSPDLQAALNLPSTAGSMAHWWLELRTSIHPGRETDTFSNPFSLLFTSFYLHSIFFIKLHSIFSVSKSPSQQSFDNNP
jgi:hypothetical protein